ncbi:hypothetical protein GCM10023324_61130 [Streptomyces youssoufiensis]
MPPDHVRDQAAMSDRPRESEISIPRGRGFETREWLDALGNKRELPCPNAPLARVVSRRLADAGGGAVACHARPTPAERRPLPRYRRLRVSRRPRPSVARC